MKLAAIIMAGGKGERLWPRSRDTYPKQFLEMIPGQGTMIQQTVKRISTLVETKDIYIVTSIKYIKIINQQLPKIPKQNILCEPEAKNTSPAIEFASSVIKNKGGEDTIAFVLPSDHVVLKTNEFIKTLKEAANLANKGYLVTLGIKPTGPDTGYGYIKAKPHLNDVEKFVEKPDLATAKQYIKNGNYYWNSGMFIWKISTILSAFSKYMPRQHQTFKSLPKKNYNNFAKKIYSKLESISIDYAVMEKANNVKVIKSDFGWDDVGSWLSLTRINKVDHNKNYIEGKVLQIDTTNSIIVSKDKLVTTLGLDNIVVVDAKNAILITTKNKLQNIKQVRNKLKDLKLNKYL